MGIVNTAQFNTTFTNAQMKKLYKRFQQIDTDGSGQLEPQQIFDVPQIAQNPLVKRVINIFDANKDGKISFHQFLKASLYGNDQQAKLKFAFKIYDINEDGFISNGDLFQSLKMMVGKNLNDNQLQQLVDRTIIKADQDLDGKISFDQFKKIVKDLHIAQRLTINQI